MVKYGGCRVVMEVSMAFVGGLCYAASWSPEVSSHLLTYLSGVGGWCLCQAQAWVGVGALSHLWNTIFTVQINRF
ncbi:hypothetical protein IGI04_005304 [Brassica rapa subsp. trilocularis]|uniref:Uncharacterized protein n=1 Tax=Brassica rapa subsp. trilocularis TaxID=1813537 RepID=A0ABQ7NG04_BRACM|nr:hypothetical protein IGI04_005304 [Brassica rapa subsp. trilocularis]